ncbi:hypothetical protein KM043_012445 [Ampulex compressa]|nr:hypothetical protein KM043_012445 [Ampulex compressa]
MYPILLWALVGLIGRAHCKCSLAPIVDDERSIAYACIHGDLNDLAEISSEARWIEFSVSRFHTIPSDAFLRFKDLRRLSFYNCHTNSISPDAFRGLDQLEWLIFHGTRLHAVKATWFRPLPNLRKLILDRCGLIHVESEVFRMLPRLETLGLRDNDLDCLPIEDLSYLRTLRTVRIDGNPWLCECRQRLESFFREHSIVQEVGCKCTGVYKYLQCMTQIGIPKFPLALTAQHAGTFETSHGHAKIPGNVFETSALTSLDRLPDKTTWIEISGLRIDAIPRYTFFRFGNSLQILELNDCYITNVEPAAFAGLHKLQRLSLIGNRFPVVGADWFRDLVGLQQLILRRNHIEHVERTAFWHVGNSLRHLDIRDNRLRCLPIGELADLKKLERIDIIGNPWTCACRRNLQRFLTDKNVGFEINDGRCYNNDNEIPEPVDRWHVNQTDVTTSITGQVQWRSFEESIKEVNVSVFRPRPTYTPSIKVHPPRPRPPVHQGTCYPQKADRAKQIYTCNGITSLSQLNALPRTVHTISIILSNLGTIPQRSFVRFDGYLSRLELRDCGVEKIEQRAFDGLYNLQYLSLHNNKLESITAANLEGLTNLRHLDLSRNYLYRITDDVFDVLPYLTSLDVSENLMNCIGVEYMNHHLPYLDTLSVSGNPWSCLCGTKLAQFLDSRGIRYDRNSLLDVTEECYSIHLPVAVTTASTMMTTVSSTTITEENTEVVEGNCMTYDDPDGLRYRCTGGNLLLLETIPADVVAIEFHDGHLPNISADCFAKFQYLRELIIGNSGVRIVRPDSFRGLHNLVNLTIQDNPLEIVGSDWFLLENLERLNLRGNSIRYIAPGAFRHLQRLTYLNLEGNDLKCIFTSDLNEIPNVQGIEYFGNPLKWRCRVELEQYLQTRKIEFFKVDNSCEGLQLDNSSLRYRLRGDEKRSAGQEIGSSLGTREDAAT